MITFKPDAKINIMTPHQNKALGIALSLATPVQLEQLKEGKDLKSVVSSLFHSKLTNTKSDQVLLDILKTNSIFKQFGNFTHELKNFVTTLKTNPELAPKLSRLENALKSIETVDLPILKGQIANSGVFMESKIALATAPMQILRETLQTLQHALAQTTQSEAKNLGLDLSEFLQHPILNKAAEDIGSAHTLIKTLQTLTDTLERILPKIDPLTPHEAKAVEQIHISHKQLATFTKPEHLLIQSQLEEHLSYDVKSQLLKLGEELKTLAAPVSNEIQTKLDQLLTNIDYHQLLSHLEGSNTLYFPFSWDVLEKGSLAFKKRDGKKFYCEINLELKEYGKIDLMMALYEGNQIEIQAHTEKSASKTLIQEHLPTLRALLTQAGINPRAIRVYDAKESTAPSKTAYTPDDTDFNAGFEVTV
ncbi:MAG: flagellar hook-length control protein FliK [Sulfuricurvum sp.]|nr:flagellar hook-length control protein FliK [Sulfuricurvum sp.]